MFIRQALTEAVGLAPLDACDVLDRAGRRSTALLILTNALCQ